MKNNQVDIENEGLKDRHVRPFGPTSPSKPNPGSVEVDSASLPKTVFIAEAVDMEDDESPIQELGIFSTHEAALNAIIEDHNDAHEDAAELVRLPDTDDEVYSESEDSAEYWFYQIREREVK